MVTVNFKMDILHIYIIRIYSVCLCLRILKVFQKVDRIFLRIESFVILT